MWLLTASPRAILGVGQTVAVDGDDDWRSLGRLKHPEKRKGRCMTKRAIFEKAFPYGDNVLALPVADLDAAANWYAKTFAMVEVERRSEPRPTVIMERDCTRIGTFGQWGR